MQKHFFLGRAIALVTCTTFLVVFPHNRNSGNTCFSVYGQYTRGIGGGSGEFSFPVVTELFGKTWIGFGKLSEGYADKTPSSQQLRFMVYVLWKIRMDVP